MHQKDVKIGFVDAQIWYWQCNRPFYVFFFRHKLKLKLWKIVIVINLLLFLIILWTHLYIWFKSEPVFLYIPLKLMWLLSRLYALCVGDVPCFNYSCKDQNHVWHICLVFHKSYKEWHKCHIVRLMLCVVHIRYSAGAGNLLLRLWKYFDILFLSRIL